jgi:hypothetical protein
MTQDEKKLLLRDLCARLPYGVKGRVSSRDCNNRECDFVATIGGKLYDRFAVAQELWFDNVTIKPYLFPLSSMTEEQKTDCPISETNLNIIKDNLGCYGIIEIPWRLSFLFIDWCNKNHFDYRGLIPLGLANDATGKNIY